MHGGHQAHFNTKSVIDNFGQRSQAVGGAGGVGDKVHGGIVGLVVYAHDKHRGIILGGGGHNDLFGAGIQMGLSLFLGQVDAGGLYDILCADGSPGNIFCVHFIKHLDLVAIDDDRVLLDLNGALETAVHGIVFQHVGHVVGRNKGVVDTDELHTFAINAGAQHQAADTAEPIDTNFDRHCSYPPHYYQICDE